MRTPRRPVRLDRRGFAATELALALPAVVLMLFGMADVVQLGRGHLRVQSTAMQIGQIISQCEVISTEDNKILLALASKLLGTFNKAEWALQITAFGQDTNGAAIGWSVNVSGGTAPKDVELDIASDGSALPKQPDGTPYQMGRNNLLYRTEVFVLVDKATLLRQVSGLAAWFGNLSMRFDSVRGEAVHTTRASSTDNLTDTYRKSNKKRCLA